MCDREEDVENVVRRGEDGGDVEAAAAAAAAFCGVVGVKTVDGIVDAYSCASRMKR
jgi:hypothetical protein